MRDRPFEVKPVRRYTVAKYPSHEDPDPCSYPDPVPFPFSRALISTIAGLGVAAGGAALAGEGSEQAKAEGPALEEQTGPDTPKGGASPNPFTVKQSGLPHRTSPYGTGQPRYIQDAIARKVIERVFREEGVRLVRDHRVRDDEVEFIADGYEPSSRIGYVFADATSLDDDAFISWMSRAPKVENVKALRSILSWKRHSTSTELVKEIDAALAIEDDVKFLAAHERVRKLLERDRLSLVEAKELEERAEKGTHFVAVISQFDMRYASMGLSTAHLSELQRKKLEAINKITDRTKRAAAWAKFHEVLAKGTLERLERNVRQYIRWARTQGI